MVGPDPALLTAVRRRSRALKQAREEREEAIRRASEAGYSLRQIGEAAGISFQAVAKILRRERVNSR